MAKTPGQVATMFDGIGKHLRLDASELEFIGQNGITMIVLRTKKGLDVDRKRFKKYSEAYKIVRRNHGLSTGPDLARSGHMIGSMEAVAGKNDVTIRFNSRTEDDKATYHNAGTTQGLPKREFMDVRHPLELGALERMIEKVVVGHVEKEFK